MPRFENSNLNNLVQTGEKLKAFSVHHHLEGTTESNKKFTWINSVELHSLSASFRRK